jgi:hypothetical protein
VVRPRHCRHRRLGCGVTRLRPTAEPNCSVRPRSVAIGWIGLISVLGGSLSEVCDCARVLFVDSVMRTLTKFTSPFAPLHLAAEDEAQLEQVANFFVRKTLAQYEKFLLRDQRIVDSDEWRLLKRKEDVRVFAQRREKEVNRRRTRAHKRQQSEHQAYTRLASSIFGGACSIFGGGSGSSTYCGGSLSSCTTATGAGSSSSHDSSPSHEEDRLPPVNLEMPVLLAVGSIPGTLEDAMYGTVAPTVEAMRVRTSYTCDHVMDGAVLATILSPSASDPFRTLSIKWIQQDYPLHLRSVIKHRDLVFLESTGTTTIASGETVGYQLLHSVHFPQTHEITGVVRGNISLCTIFRQQRQERAGECGRNVDVFTKCCLNPSEGFMRSVVINASAQSMVTVDKSIYCARMKKLAWIALRRHDSLLTSKSSGASSRRPRREDNCCVTCKKQASAGLRLLGMSERVRCKICCRFVCSACRMKKKLSYVPFDSKQLEQQEVTLCNVCVHSSMIRASALEIAKDEMVVHGRQHPRCIESPPVRMGRSRSREQAPRHRPRNNGSNTTDYSCSTSREYGSVAVGVISSSVAMDPTLEFYGEPQADRW